MAKSVTNEKGFLVIAMTPEEAIDKCKFGIYDPIYGRTILIDDHTNEIINNEPYVYYVAVLNCLFSCNSFRTWLKTATRYVEDIVYEESAYKHYAKLLGL